MSFVEGVGGEADGGAGVFGGGGEDFTAGDEGDFAAVRGEGEAAEAGGEREVGGGDAGRGAAEGDVEFGDGSGGGVEFPELEVALEDEGLAVVRKGGVEDVAVGEFRELAGGAVQGFFPDIFGAGDVGDVEEAAAVGGPLGPEIFGVIFEEGLVLRGGAGCRGGRQNGKAGFVDVGVAFAPPLGDGHAAGGEGNGAVGGVRGGLGFVGIAIGGDGDGGAPGGGNPINIAHIRDIAAI